MMRWLVVAVAAAVLCGCAQVPANSPNVASERQAAQNRARIHAELGSAYYGVGQYSVALEELKESLDADPTYVPAINQLGLVHLALGQDDKAIAEFQRALKIDPNDSSVNNNYGMLLCQRGRETEGLSYLRKVLADPLYRSPEAAHVNAGICLKNMGDLDRAESMFRKALALAPKQPQALYQMADVSYRRNNLVAAREFITRYAQATEPGLDGLWLGARIENRLGNRNALAAYGAQLNRRFPDSAQARAFNEGKFE